MEPVQIDVGHRDGVLCVDTSGSQLLPPVMLHVHIPGASMHLYLTHAEALTLRDALDEAAAQRIEVAA